MVIRKTSLKKRETYAYNFCDGTKIVLRAGENGVTEEDIKMLHAMDDAEVYNNIKNSKQPSGTEGQLEWNISMDAAEGDGELNIGEEDEYLKGCEETEREIVDRVLWFLTDIQREVFYLIKIELFTSTEVAELMGTSIRNINKHLSKAMERIEEEKPNFANNYN